MAPASPRHWRLLIGAVATLVVAAFLLPLWVPRPDFKENRVLASAPVLPRRLGEVRAFRKAVDAYVADRFPARPHLIGLLNRARMLVGVSGSTRVIVGRDGWLFYDDGTHLGAARNDPPMEAQQVRAWLATLAGRSEYVREHGGAYLLMSPPYKEMVYSAFGPPWYRGPAITRPGVVLPRLAKSTAAGDVLSLYPAVAAATRRGEKTYGRHDTHWSGYGAYAGYAALLEHLHALGLTSGPRPMSDFKLETLTTPKQPRDLASMLGVASMVRLSFPHIENPESESKLRIIYLTDNKDWTAPQIWETGETDKPTLLMSRDSYSNEILPLMLSHFSRIILSHNQDGFWRQDLIDRFKPDLVISEVIEPGLRLSAGDGPPPSAEALARIDRVVGVTATPAAPLPLSSSLTPVDSKTYATLASARPAEHCTVDIAKLTPDVIGGETLMVAGWTSELGFFNTSLKGTVRLQGTNVDLVGPLIFDYPRPDVAEAFHNSVAKMSGYSKVFHVARLPPGSYRATVYRRSGQGWIACPGGRALTAP
jgi:hypothetical protein